MTTIDIDSLIKLPAEPLQLYHGVTPEQAAGMYQRRTGKPAQEAYRYTTKSNVGSGTMTTLYLR